MKIDVGIIMGSRSDWETMQHATEVLDGLGVSYEVKVVSAHRTPDLLFEYAGTAAERRRARDSTMASGPMLVQERPTTSCGRN